MKRTFDIPDDLYEKLKALAKKNRRSVNSLVVLMLEGGMSIRHAVDQVRQAPALTHDELLGPPSLPPQGFRKKYVSFCACGPEGHAEDCPEREA